VLAEQSRATEAGRLHGRIRAVRRAGCEELAFEAATRSTKLIALNYDLPADAGTDLVRESRAAS
jgi:hypothetical protein